MSFSKRILSIATFRNYVHHNGLHVHHTAIPKLELEIRILIDKAIERSKNCKQKMLMGRHF
jgi:hypothetical protein